MGQFRPNIVVGSTSGPWEEDKWMTLRVGFSEDSLDIDFKLVKPCDRCKIPTVQLATGERSTNEEPLKTIQAKTHLPGCFGQNVQHSVLTRGRTIHVGMKLFLMDSKSKEFLAQEARKLK